ncbi:hypothetical protein J2Y48_002174 [Mycoplana sp. BE70]|uniref:hypothetical protein n=1 Tax=Mycoplana sp. BE70 TaxID=2817775 RepID=UPI00285DFBA8|nr:hypothetical protein [Mycoplana sp. BE70]MDR6756878.1 hypothetical protein [Mycoplana sp. BE70]
MTTFTMKLVRSRMTVYLSLTEGTPKGTWRKTDGVSLRADAGLWENWTLGTPGGSANIRLYDSSDTKAVLLKNVLSGIASGDGEILLRGFGGAFGDEPFQWSRI